MNTGHIRSFVKREGRLTASQARALETLWPRYGLDFGSRPIDLTGIFGRRAPLTLEIGFGNGEALAGLAADQPERDFIGIEVHRPGVGRLLNALESDKLDNVRLINHDAVEVITTMLPVSSVDQALIYFPDPWPKKRHHKRRLVQETFLAALTRVLKSGASLELATDWEEYAQVMLAALNKSSNFVNIAESGGFVPRPPRRPETRFERRGLARGHGVRDIVFKHW